VFACRHTNLYIDICGDLVRLVRPQTAMAVMFIAESGVNSSEWKVCGLAPIKPDTNSPLN
jgi:hypothetical protein